MVPRSVVTTFRAPSTGSTFRSCTRRGLTEGVGDAPGAGSHLLAPAPRLLLWAGNGILRSADAGRTWRQVQSGAPGSGGLYRADFAAGPP
jgi:hypothetical protein